MKKTAAIIALLLCFILIGCIEKNYDSDADDYKKRNYLVFNLGVIPKDLLMFDTSDVNEKDLLIALFEGLVKSYNNNIVPALAEGYEVSKDGMTYIFKIRETAKWSDGSYITSGDFVDMFSELLKPTADNHYADKLDCILGVKDYRTGKKGFNEVAIKSLDYRTLEIRLNNPKSDLLEILSEPVFTLRKIDKKLSTWKENHSEILYSGAFEIGKVTNGETIELKKNSKYWNAENIKCENLKITAFINSESALAAFDNFSIDVMLEPPYSELKRLISEDKIMNCKSNKSTYIIYKPDKVNFDNKSLAEVKSAFNISELINNILYTAEELPFVLPYAGDRNFNEAKEVGNFKGKETSSDDKKVKLIYLNNLRNKKVCEAIAKNLKESLGINIVIKSYTENEYNDKLKKSDYDMALYETTQNIDKDIENSYIKSASAQEKNQKALSNSTAFLPLFSNNTVVCKRTDIDGIEISSNGYLDITRIHVKGSP